MNEIERELNELHDEMLTKLAECGLLDIVEKYWRKRAEHASYVVSDLVDERATNIQKGLIKICHETADEVRRTRKELEEIASSKRSGTTSTKGASAV